MGQVSSKLRRTERGHAHWCPGCLQPHVIFNSWAFDGNLEQPTFNPSVKITGKKAIVDDKGEWTGEWVRDAAGNAIDDCCHYFLHAGVLKFRYYGANATSRITGTGPPTRREGA